MGTNNNNQQDLPALRKQIKDVLPFIEESAFEDSKTLIHVLKAFYSQGKLTPAQLGESIQLANKWARLQQAETGLHWVTVSGGLLAIGHKPGGKISFTAMQKENVRVVVTLLQENEGIQAIEAGLRTNAIHWIWFPFSASRPHEGEGLQSVRSLYKEIQDILSNGDKVYIHCSAGIHRTGMITYGFLRYCGFSEADAAQLLQTLRPVTAAQAGAEKLEWGNQFGQ